MGKWISCVPPQLQRVLLLMNYTRDSLKTWFEANMTALPAFSESRTCLEIYLFHHHPQEIYQSLMDRYGIMKAQNSSSIKRNSDPNLTLQVSFWDLVWAASTGLCLAWLLSSLFLPHPSQKPLESVPLINLCWLTVPPRSDPCGYLRLECC